MAVAFSKTLRSLRVDDGHGWRLGVSAALVLLGAWVAWLLFAKIRLTAVTDVARVEAESAAVPIQTELSGRVLEVNVEVGREVRANEVLLRLDTSDEDRALGPAKRQLAAAVRELDHLQEVARAMERAIHAGAREGQAAVALDRARSREQSARAKLAVDEADRLRALRRNGHAGDLETLRASVDAESREASSEASRREASRNEWAMHRGNRERQAALARLRSEIASREGACAALESAVARLEQVIERHILRAAVAGRIVEATTITPGTVVAAGTKVASIVAPGALRIVAEFKPSLVVGHVDVGQHGRLRVEGFPWTEFGALSARVRGVGAEPREGVVRVVLDVETSAAATRIPIQHGLHGLLEVDVEEVTPLSMLLRTVGAAGSPRAAPRAGVRLEAGR